MDEGVGPSAIHEAISFRSRWSWISRFSTSSNDWRFCEVLRGFPCTTLHHLAHFLFLGPNGTKTADQSVPWWGGALAGLRCRKVSSEDEVCSVLMYIVCTVPNCTTPLTEEQSPTLKSLDMLLRIGILCKSRPIYLTHARYINRYMFTCRRRYLVSQFPVSRIFKSTRVE